MSTIKFGNLASRIENKVSKNQINKPSLNLEIMLRQYETKIRDLERETVNEKNNKGYLKTIKKLEE